MNLAVTPLGELALFLVVLSDFAVLATSRLSACIRAIAFQGLLLGALPLLVHPHWSLHIVALAIGTTLIKAIILPMFLRWAIREAAVRREIEPLVGYTTSLLLGAAALTVSFAVASVLPLHTIGTDLLVSVSLVTMMIGLIVLITRSKAITQVVGYLMMENGIYLFGLTQSQRVPFLLELGVLLDVFVGVFVMGIVVFHINREFDSISAVRLTELRD
jgi:hydrogenase-4 component E